MTGVQQQKLEYTPSGMAFTAPARQIVYQNSDVAILDKRGLTVTGQQKHDSNSPSNSRAESVRSKQRKGGGVVVSSAANAAMCGTAALPHLSGSRAFGGVATSTGVPQGVGVPQGIGVPQGVGIPQGVGVPQGVGMIPGVNMAPGVGMGSGGVTAGVPHGVGMVPGVGMRQGVGMTQGVGMIPGVGITSGIGGAQGVYPRMEGVIGPQIPGRVPVQETIHLPGGPGLYETVPRSTLEGSPTTGGVNCMQRVSHGVGGGVPSMYGTAGMYGGPTRMSTIPGAGVGVRMMGEGPAMMTSGPGTYGLPAGVPGGGIPMCGATGLPVGVGGMPASGMGGLVGVPGVPDVRAIGVGIPGVTGTGTGGIAVSGYPAGVGVGYAGVGNIVPAGQYGICAVTAASIAMPRMSEAVYGGGIPGVIPATRKSSGKSGRRKSVGGNSSRGAYGSSGVGTATPAGMIGGIPGEGVGGGLVCGGGMGGAVYGTYGLGGPGGIGGTYPGAGAWNTEASGLSTAAQGGYGVTIDGPGVTSAGGIPYGGGTYPGGPSPMLPSPVLSSPQQTQVFGGGSPSPGSPYKGMAARYPGVSFTSQQATRGASPDRINVENLTPRVAPGIPTPRDWNAHATETMDFLRSMWRDGKMCDVLLQVCGVSLPCHRVAIAAHSDKYAHHFRSLHNTALVEIILSKTTPEAAKNVLCYIYTGVIEVNDNIIDAVVGCAKELGIAKIENLCKDYLFTVSIHKAFFYLEIAEKHDMCDAIAAIRRFIRRHFKEISHTANFVYVDSSRLYRLLADDTLVVGSELDVFFAILRWIDFDRDNRICHAVELLRLVRFNHVSPEDIVTQVEPIQYIYQNQECKEILYSAFRFHALKSIGSILAENSPEPITRHMMNSPEQIARQMAAVDQVTGSGNLELEFFLKQVAGANPDLATAMSANPELVRLMATSPDLARVMAGNGDLARSIAQNIELIRLLAVNLDLAREMAGHPEIARNISGNPELIRVLAMYPDLARQIATNPEMACSISTNPDIVRVLAVHPDLTRMVSTYPDIARNIYANPEIGYLLSKNPDITRLMTVNPDIARNIAANPELRCLLSTTPDIVRMMTVNVDLARNLAASPALVRVMARNPDVARQITANPDLAKMIASNPDIASIMTDNTNIALLVSATPDLARLLASNPAFVKLLSNNPDLSQRIFANPDFVNTLAMNIDFARQLAANPDLANRIASSPDFMKQLANNSDLSHKMAADPDLFQQMCKNIDVTTCSLHSENKRAVRRTLSLESGFGLHTMTSTPIKYSPTKTVHLSLPNTRAKLILPATTPTYPPPILINDFTSRNNRATAEMDPERPIFLPSPGAIVAPTSFAQTSHKHTLQNTGKNAFTCTKCCTTQSMSSTSEDVQYGREQEHVCDVQTTTTTRSPIPEPLCDDIVSPVPHHISPLHLADISQTSTHVDELAPPTEYLDVDEISTVIMSLGGVNPTEMVKESSSRTVHEYNPQSNIWNSVTQIPDYRHHHGAAAVDGNLYVIGGSLVSPERGGEIKLPTDTCYRFSTKTSQWQPVCSMHYRRLFHAVTDVLGLVYAVGGEDENGRMLDTVECYNPVDDTWHVVRRMSEAKIGAAASGFKGQLMVMGGFNEIDLHKKALATVEWYDLQSDRWSRKMNLPLPICHANSVVVKGSLYLLGGATFSDATNSITSLSMVYQYNESGDIWTRFQDMLVPRHDASAATMGNFIYVLGGMSSVTGSVLSVVECLDTVTATWIKGIGDLPYPVLGSAACTVLGRIGRRVGDVG